MPNPHERPSGVILTRIDSHNINWEYPPSGRQAKGVIRRTSGAGDRWSVLGLSALRSGSWSISVNGATLERAIGEIEKHIAAEQETIRKGKAITYLTTKAASPFVGVQYLKSVAPVEVVKFF